MLKDGRPNAMTCDSSLGACAKDKQPESACDCEMTLQVINYTTLIEECAKNSQPKETLQIFVAMREQGLEPTILAFTALIDVCVKANQLEQAL